MSYLASERPRLSGALRRLTPAATVLLAVLVMALPLPLAWGVMPHLALLAVLVWASLQPGLMPVWAAFLLGGFFDLVAGLPLGHGPLLFSLMVIAVRLAEARVDGHSLAVDWLFAALLLVLLHLLSWQLLAFTGLRAPVAPHLVQAGTSILAYPLVVAIIARIQRRLIADGI